MDSSDCAASCVRRSGERRKVTVRIMQLHFAMDSSDCAASCVRRSGERRKVTVRIMQLHFAMNYSDCAASCVRRSGERRKVTVRIMQLPFAMDSSDCAASFFDGHCFPLKKKYTEKVGIIYPCYYAYKRNFGMSIASIRSIAAALA